MTFTEYVNHYGLARSEGVVLRYLSDAYKALERTVPDEAKTDELLDLIEWLGELVRQVDSSLLDEWERLQNPADDLDALLDDRPRPVTVNTRAFRVLVRNAMFRRVELAASRRYEELGAPDARSSQLLIIDDRARDGQPGCWHVRQIFEDPEGDHDWGIDAEVDLATSDEEGTAIIRVVHVGER
jgi:hypothetical protein